mmetsp:Transcript_61006/g.178434  ORF Transcript_61006/g.178434 Transcript_61006/m.178434 type:complete len:224 (+) Transcript_61006:1301-1972(+)
MPLLAHGGGADVLLLCDVQARAVQGWVGPGVADPLELLHLRPQLAVPREDGLGGLHGASDLLPVLQPPYLSGAGARPGHHEGHSQVFQLLARPLGAHVLLEVLLSRQGVRIEGDRDSCLLARESDEAGAVELLGSLTEQGADELAGALAQAGGVELDALIPGDFRCPIAPEALREAEGLGAVEAGAHVRWLWRLLALLLLRALLAESVAHLHELLDRISRNLG